MATVKDNLTIGRCPMCDGTGYKDYAGFAMDPCDHAHPPAADPLRAEVERETIASIIAWGDETFGPCNQERAISRAWEEWQEMLDRGADVPVEAADVIICLLRIPGIADAIQRKMTINRARKWNVGTDGTGYHVKGPSHDRA